MRIQWYPGHMHKAGKDIKQLLPDIDIIVEVLDARIPFSSQNPMLRKMRADKPCISLLNKADLADPERTLEWQAYLENEQGTQNLAVSIQEKDQIKKILHLIHKLMPTKSAARQLIRTMIVGIPNVGKSTLINLLAGRTIAKTGNEPAVTRRQQNIALPGRIMLSDTPGILWPNLENRNSGYRLAVTGAIKDTAISHEDVALFAADYLLKHYPERLQQRYRLTVLPQRDSEVMEQIGAKRGCLRAGNNIDMDKAAKILLTEIRNGKLGRVTLESPTMVTQELIELAEYKARKAPDQ